MLQERRRRRATRLSRYVLRRLLFGLLILFLPITVAIAETGLQRQLVWLPEPQPKLAEHMNGEPFPAIVAALASAGSAGIELRALDRQPLRRDMTTSVQRYVQQHAGTDVFGAGVKLLLDRAQRAKAMASELAPVAPGQIWSARLSAPDAAAIAIAEQTGVDPKALSVQPEEQRDGFVFLTISSRDPRFQAAAPARVRELWYPGPDRLIAAYSIELVGRLANSWQPLARLLLVSADDGSVLRSNDLIHDLRPSSRPAACVGDACSGSGFSYRVLADRLGTPYIDPYGNTAPHPTASADGHVPTEPAPMHLLRLRHAEISTGDPWLPDGATQTLGNNVDSFFRGLPVLNGRYTSDPFANWSNDFNPEVGDFRAKTTAPGRFDYNYDVELAPDDYAQLPGAVATPIPVDSEQLSAKIVQGFYVGNWLHDLFYELGFDEVTGNMQHSNFGRGGLDGDRLIVHSGHAIGSAFAFAPADGISPVLSLGLNGFSLSNRDVAGFDFGVFVHEWTHTMFARLTQMVRQGQQGAVNEGTADFVAMFLMVQERHRAAAPGTGAFHGAYPVGAYWNLDYSYPPDGLPPAGSPGFPDNTYYHGVRRFPYSASFEINPLTFRHISPEHPLPVGFDPFDWKGRSHTSYEIHTAGEVWASALWQCARNILADTSPRQFQTRHRRFLADLVVALQLFPTDATYTEARDSVLSAVRARDEQDYRRCRAGFAARGLGADAVSPPRDSIELRGVIESFVDADPPALRSPE